VLPGSRGAARWERRRVAAHRLASPQAGPRAVTARLAGPAAAAAWVAAVPPGCKPLSSLSFSPANTGRGLELGTGRRAEAGLHLLRLLPMCEPCPWAHA
jgi:hypothetical protein